MTATTTELTAAVTTRLNLLAADGLFSITFTATRANVPIDQLDQAAAGETVVVVFPGTRSTEADWRKVDERRFEVRIAILEKLEPDASGDSTLAREDALVGLVEEIESALERSRFELNQAEACWSGSATENDLPMLAAHLEQYRQFTSVLTLSFVVLI